MTVEKRNHLEQEASTQLKINWPASKHEVARFIRAAQDYEFSLDEGFFERAHGGYTIEGFIYDLGHFGRGFRDFPFEMPLTVPKPTEVRVEFRPEEPNLQVTTTFSQLIGQIANAIEKYLTTDYLQNQGTTLTKPYMWEKEIGNLKALMEQSKDRPVTIIFKPTLDGLFEIASLENEEYHF